MICELILERYVHELTLKIRVVLAKNYARKVPQLSYLIRLEQIDKPKRIL